jgi:hypothetical protein
MTDTNARRIALSMILMAMFLMAWHILSPPEPAPYDLAYNVSWGVSFYSKLPVAYQIFGVVLFLVGIAWASLAPIARSGSGTFSNPDNWPRTVWHWLPLAAALLGVILFIVFPAAYSEGDSSLFNRLSPQRLILEPEPLDYYLKVKLFNLLSPILTLRTDAFQIMAVVAGFFYILLSFLLSSQLGRTRSEVLVMFGGLLSIANVLIFFRYIETYALVTAASLLLIWACIRFADGKIRLTTVAAIAMITALLHGLGYFWLPMIAAAWLLHTQRSPDLHRWRNALKEAFSATLVALGIFVTFVIIIVLDGYTLAQFQGKIGDLVSKGNGMFIPLFPYLGMAEPYAFFSWSHLGSIVQEHLLTAPLAFFTISVVLITSWRNASKFVRHDNAAIILIVGSMSLFLYSLFWNPDLGSRNDWDLLALPAIPFTLLALYLLLQLPDGKPKRLAITAYLVLTIVHTLGWLLLHFQHIGY